VVTTSWIEQKWSEENKGGGWGEEWENRHLENIAHFDKWQRAHDLRKKKQHEARKRTVDRPP